MLMILLIVLLMVLLFKVAILIVELLSFRQLEPFKTLLDKFRY